MMTSNNLNPSEVNWGLDELHEVMLLMLKDVHAFCEHNDILYCVAYGTALGAKRHGGFIPWDDDVDIYMRYSDFLEFDSLFQSFSKGRYYLQKLYSVGENHGIAKIRLNDSYFCEPLYDGWDIHTGIYIDIFILYDAPKSNFRRIKLDLANKYITFKCLSIRHYKKSFIIDVMLGLMRLFPKTFLLNRAYTSLSRYTGVVSADYFDTGQLKLSKSFIRKDIIYPPKKILFGGIVVNIPNQIEEYLEICYGDYLKVPSYSQITRAQHASKWEIESNDNNSIDRIYMDERLK